MSAATTQTNARQVTGPVERPDLQVVVFRLRNEFYALPVGDVREVVRIPEITPLPRAPAFLRGVTNLRGRVVPVIDLRKQLDRPGEQPSQPARVLIARLPSSMTRRGWVGLIVDSVEGVERIPAAAIQPAPELVTSQLGQDYLAGLAQLGDKLVVVLNAAGLLSPEQIEHMELSQWQKS